MTTLVPRPPYSSDEIDRLYPKRLNLQLVQIVSPTLLLGSAVQVPYRKWIAVVRMVRLTSSVIQSSFDMVIAFSSSISIPERSKEKN